MQTQSLEYGEQLYKRPHLSKNLIIGFLAIEAIIFSIALTLALTKGALFGIGVLGLLIFTVAIFFEPKLALALWVLLAFTDLSNFLGIHLYRIVLPLTLFVFLLRLLLVNKEISFVSSSLNSYIFGLVGISIFSCLFAKDIALSLRSFLAFLQAFFTFFFISNMVDSDKLLWRLIYGIYFIVLIVLTYWLLQFSRSFNFTTMIFSGVMERAASTETDPNVWAMVLVGILPLTIVFFKKNNTWFLKILFAIFGLIFTVGTLLTMSRAGIIALGIIVFLIFIRNVKFKLLGVILFTLFITGLIIVLPSYLRFRYGTIFFGGLGRDYSFWLRFTLLKAGIDVFLKHPFTGVGLGNFIAHATKYTLVPKVVHNSYLEIATGTGIIGLVLFLTILIKATLTFSRVQPHFRKRKQIWLAELSKHLQIGFIGMLICATFISVPFYPAIWAIIGISVALEQIAHKPEGTTKQE